MTARLSGDEQNFTANRHAINCKDDIKNGTVIIAWLAGLEVGDNASGALRCSIEVCVFFNCTCHEQIKLNRRSFAGS